LESLFPIYGKIKNVPNHQPVFHVNRHIYIYRQRKKEREREREREGGRITEV
jgi:outer membrane protein assembly factor BamE (lipoprotein component of BamABCDE complex)